MAWAFSSGALMLLVFSVFLLSVAPKSGDAASFSDSVKGILNSEGLPEKHTAGYYAAMVHRDRLVYGRRLAGTPSDNTPTDESPPSIDSTQPGDFSPTEDYPPSDDSPPTDDYSPSDDSPPTDDYTPSDDSPPTDDSPPSGPGGRTGSPRIGAGYSTPVNPLASVLFVIIAILAVV